MDYKGECILTENKSKLRSFKKGDWHQACFAHRTLKSNLAWLFEMERRRGESFLCLLSPMFLPFPSPSKPTFWFWAWSSRANSLSFRFPLRLPPEPRFSVGSRLCLSTGHSWFPFTQAQSTLYLLQKQTNNPKQTNKNRRNLVKWSCLASKQLPVLLLNTYQLP